jgi:hypothetical protein
MTRRGSIARTSAGSSLPWRRDDFFLSCSRIPGCLIDLLPQHLNPIGRLVRRPAGPQDGSVQFLRDSADMRGRDYAASQS